MIILNDLNGKPFVLNSDLIETVKSIPETKITTTAGKYYLVSETPEEIIQKVISFNRQIYGSDKTITFKKSQNENNDC